MARILVMDDDEQIRKVMRQVLEREGHQVVLALNGKEGIALHLDQPVDLVVTDIIMPELEGIATIMELRRTTPDLKVIAMSGGGAVDAKDYLRLAKMAGARLTLTKPIRLEQLREAVRALV